jgi:transcriptional regulator with PAS, ATPase and Fis domain
MNEEEFLSRLNALSLNELDSLIEKLEQKAKAKKEEQERQAKALEEEKERNKFAVKVPPRTSNDIQKMADDMGLDLSSLMREINRR